ncbi:MAG: hypothetical protein M0D55_01865 [Elusimicrobiota bacterium]|nr:MAG: hypothetical protein M0D55_01865 [Elusimicrobiota bacterium]
MGTPIDNETRGLNSLSYAFLLAASFLLAPYVLIPIQKMTGARVAVIFATLSAIGQVLLFLPIVSIPFSTLWVYKSTKDHEAKFRVLGRSFLRYAPVASIGFVQLIYATKHTAIYVPGFFGAALAAYAMMLLSRDRRAGA